MQTRSKLVIVAITLQAAPVPSLAGPTQGPSGSDRAQASVPQFVPEPNWPTHLPNKWMLGQISGVAVDSHDHVWIVHRQKSMSD